jgi:hypothetical protein
MYMASVGALAAKLFLIFEIQIVHVALIDFLQPMSLFFQVAARDTRFKLIQCDDFRSFPEVWILAII